MGLSARGMFCQFAPAMMALVSVLSWNSSSDAYVQRIVIDSMNTANYAPIPLGSSTAGSSVNYTIYTGRIFGTLDANDPHNSVITDITLAASPNGEPQYISQFSIVTPTNPAQRSGLLIYEVSNRGGNAISTGAMIQGATYVESGWQGDLLAQCSGAPGSSPVTTYPCFSLSNPTAGYGAGGGAYGTATSSFPFFAPPTGLTDFVIQVPIATTDGKPPNGSNTITGPVYGHIKTGTSGSTGQLVIYSSPFVPYQPATLNTSTAQFWYETSQTTDGMNVGQTSIPSSQWSWAYCPSGSPGTANPTWVCLSSGTFNPNYLYEMVFTAANPLVQGMGFAATRDLVSFLRYDSADQNGNANPIYGSITKAMNIGVSQSGAFLRAYTFYGFNQDENNRVVFDGSWVIISGRILWMNERWAQPNVLLNLYMGGNEAPIWWADWPNEARGLPAAGILDRCTASNTCPQVMETWGGNEFYNNKMGADFTGFCDNCSAEIPQPANVHRYYVAGATHGGGAVSFNWSAPPTTPVSATQTYPASPIPETYTNNALQYAFIEFLMNGTAMPPSISGVTYPSFTQGQLVPATAAAVGWPTIPGVPYGGNQAWPPFVYDFGTGVNYAQQTGIPTIQPPIIESVLTAYVPTVNADGNENVGAIPTVLSQAPLGTYMGWNIIPTGPYAGQQVVLTAGYWPFWDTKANRMSAGDPRLSLEERYGTHTGYNCVVRQAANTAINQRFLLPSDAQILIADASAGNALTSFTPTPADVGFANGVLCGLTDTHDLNGDGKSDILWQDIAGDVALWLMNGGTISQAAGLGNVPGAFSIIGQHDFDGDGNADILWRDTGGNIYIWFMNGGSITSTATVGNLPGNWSLYGTADLNGDGKGDLLFRDSISGAVVVWFMNGATVASTTSFGAAPNTWTIVGEANNSILWQDTTGDIAVWQVQNGVITASAAIGSVPSNVVVRGVGDFDGDGNLDVLLQDTNAGTLMIWFTKGTQVSSVGTAGAVGNSWKVAQIGDYNGDGHSDILFLDTTGNLAVWLMSGATILSPVSVGNVGTTWQVQNLNAN
jgi:Alpha/beta hydrolase domain/FG-GAP-like repeat